MSQAVGSPLHVHGWRRRRWTKTEGSHNGDYTEDIAQMAGLARLVSREWKGYQAGMREEVQPASENIDADQKERLV